MMDVQGVPASARRDPLLFPHLYFDICVFAESQKGSL